MPAGESVGGQRRVGRLPSVRQEFIELAHRPRADPRQHVRDVGKRIHALPLAGGYQAGRHHPGPLMALRERVTRPLRHSRARGNPRRRPPVRHSRASGNPGGGASVRRPALDTSQDRAPLTASSPIRRGEKKKGVTEGLCQCRADGRGRPCDFVDPRFRGGDVRGRGWRSGAGVMVRVGVAVRVVVTIGAGSPPGRG